MKKRDPQRAGLTLVLISLALTFIIVSDSLANEANEAQDPPAASALAIYDPDPKHVWNRLYQALYLRGLNENEQLDREVLDPLLWSGSEYLLGEPSHGKVIKLLDEFIESRGERSIEDSLKRAMLQRDLWAVFDWVAARHVWPRSKYEAQSMVLAGRLAAIMKRLALSKEQIQALPDSFSAALSDDVFPDETFLKDLFTADGSWVLLGSKNEVSPVPYTHSAAFRYRSSFTVSLRLPAGREQTLKYLRELNSFPNPMFINPEGLNPRMHHYLFSLNRNIPELIMGTRLALVRRMVLIDNTGRTTVSPIVESIQLRVCDRFQPDVGSKRTAGSYARTFFEFHFRRKDLFAGQAGGLHKVGLNERGFSTVFRSHGIDPFERPQEDLTDPPAGQVTLKSCAHCHGRSGVRSHGGTSGNLLLSYILRLQDLQKTFVLVESSLGEEDEETILQRESTYSWGLLQGFWHGH